MRCEPEAARTARLLVMASLNTWGLNALTDVGTLIIAELFSNAVRHTSCRLVRVSVQRIADDRVRISVTDKNRGLPELGGGDRDQEGGRGLLLIDALADRWGYDLLGPIARPAGKRCWAELLVAKADEACGTGRIRRLGAMPPDQPSEPSDYGRSTTCTH
ncbi:ATP-binding protein [Streptomyces adelaidensis]|uniref:ATP-binding protein n=1 Tax=Streptomyces adelaidensis TaxID=2796465 RepID=UPI001F157F5E|nr:ATP-binding protein [Streptomyces adelaidensis]